MKTGVGTGMGMGTGTGKGRDHMTHGTGTYIGTGTGIKTFRSKLESVWHSFVQGWGRHETPLETIIGFDMVPLLATSRGGSVLTMTWL